MTEKEYIMKALRRTILIIAVCSTLITIANYIRVRIFIKTGEIVKYEK